MLELLALIPELTVLMIEKGCSGMAGTFGIAAANFSKSVEIGRRTYQRNADHRCGRRGHRLQFLPHANGTGCHDTDDSSHQAAGSVVWPDASAFRTTQVTA